MSKGLALKICVITGWVIPDSEEYVTILDGQLQKKMVDSYQSLNSDEFEYALRTYGTKIKDWGKFLNLALIDDAICEYLGLRQHLSNLEEQKRIKDPEIDALPAGPVDWSEEWEKLKLSARNGTIRESFIATPIYDWLLRNGMITVSAKERWQILEDCRQAYALEMKEALQNSNSKTARAKYELLVKEGNEWREDPDLWTAVINYSKRHTVKIEAQNAIMDD